MTQSNATYAKIIKTKPQKNVKHYEEKHSWQRVNKRQFENS